MSQYTLFRPSVVGNLRGERPQLQQLSPCVKASAQESSDVWAYVVPEVFYIQNNMIKSLYIYICKYEIYIYIIYTCIYVIVCMHIQAYIVIFNHTYIYIYNSSIMPSFYINVPAVGIL